ncbi:MAG: M48 family metallopeptidase [Pseudomonadota bacterium]
MSAPHSDDDGAARHLTELRGEWFPTGSGRATPARLRGVGKQAYVHEVDGKRLLTSAAREDLDISQRLDSVARRTTFPDGSVFVTYDDDGVDRLIGTSDFSRLINWLEVPHPRLLLVALFGIALIIGVYRYGIPVLVTVAVAVTPQPVVELVSDAALQGIERQMLSPTRLSDARQQDLSEVFEDLIVLTSGAVQARDPVLLFRDAAIGANAFALPDGTIIVTDDLVRQFSEEEVAAVMAHELGHVEYQHGLRLLYRSVGLFALITLITGDASGIFNDIALQGGALVALAYSREHEHEADAYAVDLMITAGRDPMALATFFEKISEETSSLGALGWLSTHPETDERIDAVRERIGQQRPVGSTPL